MSNCNYFYFVSIFSEEMLTLSNYMFVLEHHIPHTVCFFFNTNHTTVSIKTKKHRCSEGPQHLVSATTNNHLFLFARFRPTRATISEIVVATTISLLGCTYIHICLCCWGVGHLTNMKLPHSSTELAPRAQSETLKCDSFAVWLKTEDALGCIRRHMAPC